METTIDQLIAIRVTLEQIEKPEYTLQYAITELDKKIYEWSKAVTIVNESITTDNDTSF